MAELRPSHRSRRRSGARSGSGSGGRRPLPRVRYAAVVGLALLLVGGTIAVLATSKDNGSAPVPPTALPSPMPAVGATYTLKPVRQGPVTGWKLPVPLSGPRGIAIGSDG